MPSIFPGTQSDIVALFPTTPAFPLETVGAIEAWFEGLEGAILVAYPTLTQEAQDKIADVFEWIIEAEETIFNQQAVVGLIESAAGEVYPNDEVWAEDVHEDQ